MFPMAREKKRNLFGVSLHSSEASSTSQHRGGAATMRFSYSHSLLIRSKFNMIHEVITPIAMNHRWIEREYSRISFFSPHQYFLEESSMGAFFSSADLLSRLSANHPEEASIAMLNDQIKARLLHSFYRLAVAGGRRRFLLRSDAEQLHMAKANRRVWSITHVWDDIRQIIIS